MTVGTRHPRSSRCCCWSRSSSTPQIVRALSSSRWPRPASRRSTCRRSLLNLTLNHLAIVAIATLAATVVAVGLAILVTRPFGAEFLPL